MIVHILNGIKYHLSPSISRGFCSTYRDIDEPIFIIYGTEDMDKEKYESIFKEYNILQFFFCYSYSQYVKLLTTYRNNPILFHGGDYKYMLGMFMVRCKNVNWVCWGAGTTTNTWRSRLISPLKRYMYQHFNSIITLMDDDKTSIQDFFSVNPDIVHTISYQTTTPEKDSNDILCWNLMHEMNEVSEKPIIMLGNNSHQITDYIKLLTKFEPFKGKVRIWCMMNYSLVKDSNYMRLIQLGKGIYGDDFESREEFYEDRESLLRFMNRCDVYVCISDKQTGLGAIGNCCLLGKKIYITGRNYNWMSSAYGVKIFKSESLDTGISFNELVKPLTIDEKEYNYNCILNRSESQYQLWKSYLTTLQIKNTID